jgi:hypothetical protein|tara:strand:+ start:432 stop:719 length:288 start_codon:yes stop_codon:yes gene_type:complete
MLEVSTSQAGNVNVIATQNEGLSLDHWAERATNTIVSVGSQSHPVIQEQANAFKQEVLHVIKHYMSEAVKSSRTDLIAEFEQGGYKDMAEILRKM